MDALHRMGGVPPDWQLTPSPGDVAAGRQAFQDFGCHNCHRVAGEQFSAKETTGVVGPDLSGMGAHHPPGYFAEAILNPDAVLIDGPGYIGPDGHSAMPDYPDMTIRQLDDLVAYLSSLKTGGDHAGHVMAGGMPMPAMLQRNEPPAPSANGATSFYAQSYDIQIGKVDAFEQWFASEGAKQFLAADGVVGIDTYVDNSRLARSVTTVFAFRDDAALTRFMNDPATEQLGARFDSFIGEHDHSTFRRPPLYRVPALSAP
jgi:mono/diheme cytochrome c family protein